MRKQILSLLVVLLIGSTVCMAQDRQKGKVDREKRIEQIITDLGLNEKQAKDFKAAMEEMRPTKRNSNERPSREEMQKKRKEGEAKIKSILTDEQYKKYQDMRKKENAVRKKSTKLESNSFLLFLFFLFFNVSRETFSLITQMFILRSFCKGNLPIYK